MDKAEKHHVIARNEMTKPAGFGVANQSRRTKNINLDCFVAALLAMTNKSSKQTNQQTNQPTLPSSDICNNF
jgi:hypothetical protein